MIYNFISKIDACHRCGDSMLIDNIPSIDLTVLICDKCETYESYFCRDDFVSISVVIDDYRMEWSDRNKTLIIYDFKNKINIIRCIPELKSDQLLFNPYKNIIDKFLSIVQLV